MSLNTNHSTSKAYCLAEVHKKYIYSSLIENINLHKLLVKLINSITETSNSDYSS